MKWFCTEHDQNEWHCVVDADGCQYHFKRQKEFEHPPMQLDVQILSPKTNIKMSDTTDQLPKQSLGEQRVRTDFNVSGKSVVDEIKQKTAELINLCETLKGKDGRLSSLAQTAYEEAAMWAVKCATA